MQLAAQAFAGTGNQGRCFRGTEASVGTDNLQAGWRVGCLPSEAGTPGSLASTAAAQIALEWQTRHSQFFARKTLESSIVPGLPVRGPGAPVLAADRGCLGEQATPTAPRLWQEPRARAASVSQESPAIQLTVKQDSKIMSRFWEFPGAREPLAGRLAHVKCSFTIRWLRTACFHGRLPYNSPIRCDATTTYTSICTMIALSLPIAGSGRCRS